MTAYLKSHRWLAAVVLVAAIAFAAGCSTSSKDSKLRTSSGPPSNGSTTGAQPPAGTDSSVLQSTGSGEAGKSGVIADSSGAPVAASGGSTSTGSGAEPNALPSILDRKIIQTATLTLTTDSVSQNFENVGNIAASVGGFIASSSYGNDGDRQTASITIRVPGDKYQDTLIQLRKLGDVKGEQSGANDITEEYTDLQSRVNNLRSVEAQYVQFLSRAESISDVLTVQDRLNSVRAEIDQVQGRINLLQHQTDLATITVHLDPPVIAKTDKPKTTNDQSPLDVAADSFQASLDVLLGIATVVLAVAAFSWWLLPLAIVGLFFGRRQTRNPRDPRSAPPPPAPSL